MTFKLDGLARLSATILSCAPFGCGSDASVLVTAEHAIEAMALARDSVYYAGPSPDGASTRIVKTSKSGEGTEIVTTTPSAPGRSVVALAAGEHDVFWLSDEGELSAVSLHDLSVRTWLGVSPQGARGAWLALQGDSIFWSNNGPAQQTMVHQARIDSAPHVQRAFGTSLAEVIAIDDVNLYSSAGSSITIDPRDDAGTSRRLGAWGAVRCLASDGTRLYWMTASQLRTANVESFVEHEEGTRLAEVEAPEAMALDASGVYWIDSADDGRALRSASLDGTEHRRIASLPAGEPVRALLLDATTIYWVEGSSIMAAPKR